MTNGDELVAAWRLVADAIAQRRLYGACPQCSATLPGPDARYCSRACHRKGSATVAANGRFAAPVCRGCGRTTGVTWGGLCPGCERASGNLPDGFGGSVTREDVLDVMEWLVGQRTAPPLSDRRTTW